VRSSEWRPVRVCQGPVVIDLTGLASDQPVDKPGHQSSVQQTTATSPTPQETTSDAIIDLAAEIEAELGAELENDLKDDLENDLEEALDNYWKDDLENDLEKALEKALEDELLGDDCSQDAGDGEDPLPVCIHHELRKAHKREKTGQECLYCTKPVKRAFLGFTCKMCEALVCAVCGRTKYNPNGLVEKTFILRQWTMPYVEPVVKPRKRKLNRRDDDDEADKENRGGEKGPAAKKRKCW
jgi:hypothetical protein